MGEPRKMRPNINFLRKVERGEVEAYMGYSMKRGGYYGVRGGEATWATHAAVGYVTPLGGASLGKPSVAKLTEAGLDALRQAAAAEREEGR